MLPSPCSISADEGQSHRGELESLARWFDIDLTQLGHFEPIAARDLPADFAELLVHHSHMTVSVEKFHDSLVDVQVLSEHPEDNLYGRQILLTRRRDEAVVQYGIMRIDLDLLPDKARHEVETHAAPLGRVLITNKLMRDVELLALWKILPSTSLAQHLDVPTGQLIYGRSARILLDKRPAVELLEIVKV